MLSPPVAQRQADQQGTALMLHAGLDWKMTTCSSLVAGYREWNVNKSGGVGGTAFDFNAKMYGPFVAVAFQF